MLDNIENKENSTKIPSLIWLHILHYLVPSEHSNVALVSKFMRRAIGALRSAEERNENHGIQLELEQKFLVKSSGLPIGQVAGGTAAPDTVQSLKIAKTMIEEQLKQAAALLTEETKLRIAAEGKVKEFSELPLKILHLEEVSKRYFLVTHIGSY